MIIVWMVLLTGCATKIGVRQVDLDDRFENMDRSALTSDSLSERTTLFLRQRDLTEAWEDEPMATLEKLDQDVQKQPDRDMLFTLTELCFYQAKNAPKLSDEAAELYLTCAYYAYTYLFDEKAGHVLSPYNPYSRLACDFYNRSFAGYLLYFRKGDVRFKENMRLPFLRGQVKVTSGRFEMKWRPKDFDRIYIAYEFEPEGLDNHIKTYGVGVPIIAVRIPEAVEKRKGQDRFLPEVQQTYAATALMRFITHEDEDQSSDRLYTAELDLYDPMKTHEIRIGDSPVPLETDFTTPLAYMVGHSKMPGGISGLFKVESWEKQKGLHLLQPYEPNKIPVVFVHGLMSSPQTWLKMFNNLLADTRIREKYQFWFFMYPTGNPILYSASILRESLKEARQVFDPDGNDPAFDEMVLVSHSMGGLLSKYMVLTSGDEIWEEISDVPFSDMDFTPDQHRLAERVFFFEQLPFVSRVVFISTPHRGSEWASGRIARWGISLVKLPFRLVNNGYGMLEAIGQGEQGRLKMKLERMPTGVDGLKPDSLFVRISEQLPLPDDIPYHSIIGNNEAGDVPGGTDGIVPYTSSHLDGAVSEKIVRSGHSAHNHPLAIQEVRRILHEHLDAVNKANAL